MVGLVSTVGSLVKQDGHNDGGVTDGLMVAQVAAELGAEPH